MNTQTRAAFNAKSSSNFRLKAVHLAVASCFAVMPMASLAFTVNHDKTGAGSGVTQTGSGTNNVTISTTATKTILNWPSFNILSGEKVRFAQISASSAVMNRVNGGGMSQILGTLSSNGKVYLINPAGVMIGAGARIDTAAFVASTLNMTDSDFLNGKNRFNANTLSAGKVSNAGEITTPNGGFVYLLAPQVENSGVITTPSGEAILAAGHSVEMVDSSDPAMRVKVSAKSQDVNLSQIVTQNGGNIFSVLNSGKVSANTAVVGQNGKVQFRSAGKLNTTATSVVEAKGTSTLDGGYFRGFADTNGIYKGSIDVSGRNGGFIETSGRYLDVGSVQIKANALSASGKAGTWLLDPYNIIISSTGTEDIIYDGSTYYGGSRIYDSTINSVLNAGTNVVIDTGFGAFYISDHSPSQDGNILVAADAHIHKSYGGNNSLTLNADSSIDVFGIIDDDGINNLTLNMNAGLHREGAATSGGVAFHNGSSVNIHGDFNLSNYNAGAVVFENTPITAYDIDIFTYNTNGSITGSGALQKLEGTNSVRLNAYGGNIGAGGASDYLNVDTSYLTIGDSSTPGTVHVIDTGSLYNADIFASGNVSLNVAGGVEYGGDISIHTPGSADIFMLIGDLELTNADINFYGGGEYTVTAPNIIMNNSEISANDYNGGQSLGIFANNLSMYNSHIEVNSYYGGVSLGVFVGQNMGMTYSSLQASSYYGGASLVAQAETLTMMNNSQIGATSYYGGAGTSVFANNLSMTNYSDIYAESYGGSAVADAFAFQSLTMDHSNIHARGYYGGTVNIAALDLTMNNGSQIYADSYLGGSFVGVNFDSAFLAGAKNGSVNINDGSSIYANAYYDNAEIGIVTGELNIDASYDGYGGTTGIFANSYYDGLSQAEIIVAGDMTLNGGDAVGYGGGFDAVLSVGDELSLTLGGHLNLNTSADGYGAAQISVDSIETLFMDFPVLTADGFLVDGVANAFTSTRNPYTGIFVDGAPGIIGTNTFVDYNVLTPQAKAGIIGQVTKDQITPDTPDNNGGGILANNDAADDFFGNKDEEDENGDKKDNPKQCS